MKSKIIMNFFFTSSSYLPNPNIKQVNRYIPTTSLWLAQKWYQPRHNHDHDCHGQWHLSLEDYGFAEVHLFLFAISWPHQTSVQMRRYRKWMDITIGLPRRNSKLRYSVSSRVHLQSISCQISLRTRPFRVWGSYAKSIRGRPQNFTSPRICQSGNFVHEDSLSLRLEIACSSHLCNLRSTWYTIVYTVDRKMHKVRLVGTNDPTSSSKSAFRKRGKGKIKISVVQHNTDGYIPYTS